MIFFLFGLLLLNGVYERDVWIFFYDLECDKALFSVNICLERYLLNVNGGTLKQMSEKIRNMLAWWYFGVVAVDERKNWVLYHIFCVFDA